MKDDIVSLIKNVKIYSWQISQWEQLIARKWQQRIPHALLFIGEEGLGKKQFASALAHALLCNKTDTNGNPCGTCHACHLIHAQTHPDLVLIEPEQAGQAIKIDQIREVVQFVNATAQQGGFRVVIINPANAMNVNSANALLKTLEEPTPNTLIILIGGHNLRLPMTIASRCQKILFQKPAQEVAINWLRQEIPSLINAENEFLYLLLKMADGAPLKAKKWIENDLIALRQDFYQGLNLLSQRQADPLQLAQKWQDQDIVILLSLLLIWLQDLLRVHIANDNVELLNVDYQLVFARLKNTSKLENLINYLDYVKKIYGYMLGSLNLNRQLLLEEVFIRWMQYVS